ncbi:MAG: bacterial Ig-like domain-containing protein [Bacteroidaceae bacterium]|nr:bacterial Ig-like domain-containing protein [Bacteroidaceae bacterium]
MKQFTLKSLMLLLLLLIGGGSYAWGETKTGSWDLTKKSAEWTASGNVEYFKQPYGFKKANGTLTNKSIADFSIDGISQIKVGFKCLRNGNETSELTIWLVDKDGKTLGDGVVVTPDNQNVASKTTYQYATFTTNLEAATGFMMKVTKFGKNILVNGAQYEIEYSATPAANLTSIAVSGTPTKTTYEEGEAFDPTGLVVTATYEDESTEVVTSRVKWTFNPETLILGTTEVNVTATYGEKTASKTVAVTVAEVQKYNVTWNVNGNDYTEGNPTTEVVEGEKVEVLPAAPASIVGLVFMGWTNEAVTSQEAAPAVLFTSAADAPAVTADVTYYAVFAAQAGAGWTRVTALSDITEGSYVIKNAGFILPNFKTDKSPQKVTAPSITDNVITGEVDESMVWQFVSTGVSNQFYIKNAAGNYLYVIKGESQGLRVVETPGKWTFEENGVGYFAMMDENSSRYCATYEAGKDWRSYLSKDHGNYANGGKLELYRNDISYSNYTTTVETNSLILRAFDGKNHFATFSSDKAVKFVDATVYAVGVNDDRLILTEVESKQVPANTGVLLKSAGTEATYSVIGSAPAIENNLLCASVEEGQTTAADGTTEGYSFFKLSYSQAGENEKLGFYWAKENGAPFVSKAGLAYLAVKTADVAAVKGFSLFDMETGISKVSGSAAGNGVIYDLQGRRVERAVRGLYIVNGRKVMVK